MKAYTVEYGFEIRNVHWTLINTEQRLRMFHNVREFVNEVHRLKDVPYVHNIKCYVGELEEINIEKVLAGVMTMEVSK